MGMCHLNIRDENNHSSGFDLSVHLRSVEGRGREMSLTANGCIRRYFSFLMIEYG